jgi:hypothetical protein
MNASEVHYLKATAWDVALFEVQVSHKSVLTLARFYTKNQWYNFHVMPCTDILLVNSSLYST